MTRFSYTLLRPRLAALAPALVLAILGAAMVGLAYTQPAWLGARIGPGLFAQWLSKGVVALSVLWGIVILATYRAGGAEAPQPDGPRPLVPGFALLAAVMVFAVLLPVAGLIVACAVAAALASWGTGDRSIRALALSALAAGFATLALGLTLLPPATRLWPWDMF